MLLVDGSWYGLGALDRLEGRRDAASFAEFLGLSTALEHLLADSGFTLVKCWLADDASADEPDREMRRLASRWKAGRHALDTSTAGDHGWLRRSIVEATSADAAPWHVVQCDDRWEARLSCLRHILDQVGRQGEQAVETTEAEAEAD
jgi:polyphosphate kinase 2 (PPK2 family)